MKNTPERTNIEERPSTFRRILPPLCAVSIISGIVIATVGSFRTIRTERMRTEVARIADTNNDSIPTHDEWIPIYDSLGQPYWGMEGTDLSPEQLRDYLSENSK